MSDITQAIQNSIDVLTDEKISIGEEIKTKRQEFKTIDQTIQSLRVNIKSLKDTTSTTAKTKKTSKNKKGGFRPPIANENEVKQWIRDKKEFTEKEISEHFKASTSWFRQRLAKKFLQEQFIIIKKTTSTRESNKYYYNDPNSKIGDLNALQNNTDYDSVEIKKISRRNGSPVPGTGKSAKLSSDHTVNKLIEKALSQGYTAEKAGSGHIKIKNFSGEFSTTIPSTPSDYRSIENAKSNMRKIGVVV